ncbi:MAG: OB-fold domain-containing protein [Pseudomonadales bacterium]|nr:OB-fold domain-containing protein [Pseudomonadales bacterium]
MAPWRGRRLAAGVASTTTAIRLLQEDQPFNVAVIMLNDDPGIQMYSHLPGTPVDDVPVGADVEVVFEATANGQKVPEWRVVAEVR